MILKKMLAQEETYARRRDKILRWEHGDCWWWIARDSWWPRQAFHGWGNFGFVAPDKTLHLAVSFLAGFGALLVLGVWAWWIVAALAVIWEIGDIRWADGFSYKDLAWDAVGLALARLVWGVL